jgi:hypothetical protein
VRAVSLPFKNLTGNSKKQAGHCKLFATHAHKKAAQSQGNRAAGFHYFISNICRARLIARVSRRW